MYDSLTWTWVIVLLFTNLFWGIVSYCIGIYRERYAWNKLIRKGILPRPKK